MKMATETRGREALGALEFLAVDFLPGRLVIERGRARDYRELGRFHYVMEAPATWAGVWRIVYEARSIRDAAPLCPGVGRVVAVGVLSWPLLSCRARDGLLGLRRRKTLGKMRFLNRHVRTISRVIVHPQFRSLGLASRLVRRICAECPTRFVEAVAVMGRVHPFFERGGMERVGTCGKDGAYFFLDRMDPGRRCALSRRGGGIEGMEVLS